MCVCRDVTRIAPVSQRMKRCSRCSDELGADWSASNCRGRFARFPNCEGASAVAKASLPSEMLGLMRRRLPFLRATSFYRPRLIAPVVCSREVLGLGDSH